MNSATADQNAPNLPQTLSAVRWSDLLDGVVVKVESIADGHNVKCPRCWHWHGVTENFGHLPEEIVADPKLAKEKLCDRCQQIILIDFPNHPSAAHIKAALAAQRDKYTQPFNDQAER
jgi:hypothetical protein